MSDKSWVGSGSVGTSWKHCIVNDSSGGGLVDIVSDGSISTNGTVKASDFRIRALNTAPASVGSTGTAGEVRFTADHVYVCTATDTWKRAALTTWA